MLLFLHGQKFILKPNFLSPESINRLLEWKTFFLDSKQSPLSPTLKDLALLLTSWHQVQGTFQSRRAGEAEEHPAYTTVGPSEVSGLQPASVHPEEHTAGGKKLKPSKAVLMLLTKGQGNAPKTFPFCCWNMKMTRLANKTCHQFFRSVTFTEHYVVWTIIWRHNPHKIFLNKLKWYSCLQLMQNGSRNYNAHLKQSILLCTSALCCESPITAHAFTFDLPV